MKTLKKTLCLVLAVVMVVGALVLPASAAYKDVNDIDDDYTTAVNLLERLKVMEGDANGNFKPTASIQRQEMAAIVYRLLTGDTAGYGKDNSAIYKPYAEKFTDVKSTDWAAGYIGYCANKGIIVGTNAAQTTFEPARAIPANDVLAMLLRAVGYGQNNEYTGPGWTKNIASDANRLGLTKGITRKLDLVSERQEVAQMTYNAALNAPRVTYVNGNYSFVVDPRDPSSKETVSLIAKGEPVTSDQTYDVWGAPESKTTKTTYTWTFPAQKPGLITKTLEDTEEPKALYSEYNAITECNLYDAVVGKDGKSFKAYTYTNGKLNANLGQDNVKDKDGYLTVEALDTVNKVGHQGRLTSVYANPDTKTKDTVPYIIVFVDTFLGTVKSVQEALYDTAGHKKVPDSATITVIANEAACGGSGDTEIDLTVEGTGYTVGQKVAVQVATVKDVNTLATTGTNSYNTAAGAAIVSVSPITPVTAKVTNIVRDSNGGNQREIGFVAGGTQYLYNYTFKGDVLKGDAIDENYIIWADKSGSVLAVEEAPTESGVGVVLSSKSNEISVGKYAVTYTVLTANGQTVEITTDKDAQDTPAAFTSAPTADTDKTMAANEVIPDNALVSFTKAGDYYTVTVAPKTGKTDAATDVIYEGLATALSVADQNYYASKNEAKDLLVNDNTVFFVAEYKPDVKTPDEADDYVFTEYKIVNGFKNLQDRGITKDSKFGSSSVSALEVMAIESETETGYAKYVLILNATQHETNDKETVLNYAFLQNNDVFQVESDGTYTYKAYVNGANTTVKVQVTAAKNIKNYGLYAYEGDVNGEGASKVWFMDGLTTAGSNKESGSKYENDPVFSKSFKIEKDKYKYANSVLAVDDTNAASSTQFGQGTMTYYTIANDCAVYVVNPTTGYIKQLTLSALNTAAYGKDCDIWYQLDEYGYVDYIYIVDTKADDNPNTPSTTGVGTFTSITLTGPSKGDVLEDTKPTVAPTTDADVDKVVWEWQNPVTHAWETVDQTTTFQEGVYHMIVTLKAQSNKAFTGSVTVTTLSGFKVGGEASSVTLKGTGSSLTFTSDAITVAGN